MMSFEISEIQSGKEHPNTDSRQTKRKKFSQLVSFLCKPFRRRSNSEVAADQGNTLIINPLLRSTDTHSSELSDRKSGHKNKNNPETLTYEAKEPATENQKRPSFTQSIVKKRQDSHYLLNLVADEIIKRLIAPLQHFNIQNHKTRLKYCSEDGRKLLRKYGFKFKKFFVITRTFINNTFGGQMIWIVKCENCSIILNILFVNTTRVKKFLDYSYPAKESGKTHEHIPQPITCETKDAVGGDQKKQNQPEDCKDNKTKSIFVIGLYNLGNSCYFNSVLQNLLLLHPFSEHLIGTMTRTEYRLILEKYPHFNAFINSNKKGEKGSFNRNISRQNECQLRIIECKYCSATIQRKVLENHNKICPEFPLVCPNECLKSVIRKELKSHIEKECPNTLITCPYKEMGCEVLIKRSELPEHEKPFESKHFDKPEEFYLNKVKELESIVQEKEDENNRLKSIMEEKEDTIKRLTAEIQKRQKQSETENICVMGLSNLGNTCYFNSVLQNLLYLRPFKKRLSYTMTRTEYKLVPKKHPELKTIEFASDKKAEPGKLTKELFNLIQETIYQSEATKGTFGKKAGKRNTQKIAKPKAVQIEIAKKHDKFSDGTQQDSHELFRFMIDMVKDEEIQRLKIAFEKHFSNNKTQSKNCSVDGKNLKKYASEFENIFVFTGTFIDDTFGGNMLSTVTCEGCGSILDVNEDFLDISLPLPEYSKEHNIISSNQPQSGIESNYVKSKEVKRLNRMANNYPKDSLEYYLMRFFSPIFLEEDYVCNNCNPQLISNQDETSDMSSDENDDTDSIDYDALIFTSAVKQFHIKSVGPVLTIHLKRFSQTGYGLQKLDKPVDFPLVLDMSPFCVSDTSVPKDCSNRIMYGLRGIVDHSGGMFGGHYVAHVNIADWNVKNSFARENGTCKSPDSDHKLATLPEEWYYISDSHVSNTNHARVFGSQAYILFYERLPL